MKEKIITKQNGTRVRIKSRQIHTRKIDRMVARHNMAKQYSRICKHNGVFSDRWREFVPD